MRTHLLSTFFSPDVDSSHEELPFLDESHIDQIDDGDTKVELDNLEVSDCIGTDEVTSCGGNGSIPSATVLGCSL